MPTPFISVLIDTYNHERFIEQALDSVLAQDYPIDRREILVVDDGSTDNTPTILAKYGTQIRILRKANGGQASAFNFGIPQCRGEIVSFLDADDWWLPQKLSRVAAAMNANPSAGIVGHGIINIQPDGSELVETLREPTTFRASIMEGALLFRRRCSFLGTSRMTIRADLLRQIGAIPEEIRIQADEFLFTLASVISGVHILPDALTYYRMHDANSFQMASFDPAKLRRKQQSLQALANSLSQRMAALNIEPAVRHAVIAYTQASADRLRLEIDGGWSWETMRTEWNLYRIGHPEARYSHRIFKMLILFGALFTTPKFFYGAQRRLSRSDSYRRARQRWLPIPEMQHIQKDLRKKS
jgi:glycosyltransferase involved in cell wall biosynthesis